MGTDWPSFRWYINTPSHFGMKLMCFRDGWHLTVGWEKFDGVGDIDGLGVGNKVVATAVMSSETGFAPL